MTITESPADKYAFLFTGPAEARYLTDLQNVFQTITEYYNYPAANITVVLGSEPAVDPSFPGATLVKITTEAQLTASLTAFASNASGATATGVGSKTALLYFTGRAKLEGVSKLVIDGGDGNNNVDSDWLKAILSTFQNCHVNVVMQQAYSGGFKSAFTDPALTLAQWSFTSACSDAEDSFTDESGGFFTNGWVRGLKLEALPDDALKAGEYADELGSVGDGTDRLISLGEAMEFAKQLLDSDPVMGKPQTPGYDGIGPQWLGLPAFLIRDGTPWWESPDIYLTYPNDPGKPAGDLYIPDPVGVVHPPGEYNNTINVNVRNVGTHPVRIYSLGIELFKTGAGGASDTKKCDVPVLLLPMDPNNIGSLADDHVYTYMWNTPFYEGTTHKCVKAEAQRLCADLTLAWSDSSVQANNNEGQRNTDEMIMMPSPPATPLPTKNLQGFKEHIYGIHNRFETPRRFILVFPDELVKYEGLLDLKWFAVPEKGQAEVVPLEVVNEPVPHIPISLKGGESRNIILRVTMRPRFNLEGAVRLPFDIMVQGDWPRVEKELALAARLPSFASIGGFTVVVRKGGAVLKGAVLDAEKKPVAEARVFLRTVDDRQGAVLTTDGNGRYGTTEINPDVYRIWAEAKNWRSKEQITVLLGGEEKVEELQLAEEIPASGKRIKVILDKIQIMNDHDPCIKGRGELTFTTVVVPDDDPSRKQVTRLPPKGEYKVSDKPGENRLNLGVTLFDGLVVNRALSIDISGKEIDLFDPDDELNRYHREFCGDPETWYGQYSPSDEYLDKEDVGDWALWYRIVRN